MRLHPLTFPLLWTLYGFALLSVSFWPFQIIAIGILLNSIGWILAHFLVIFVDYMFDKAVNDSETPIKIRYNIL